MKRFESIVATLVALTMSAYADSVTNALERTNVEAAETVAIDVAALQPVPYAVEVDAVATAETAVPKALDYASWYDRIEAVPGSKASWIILVSRDRAKRGEDTEWLHTLLTNVLAKWMDED